MTTTATTKAKWHTVTLTNRAPVRIRGDQWSTVAKVSGDSYSGLDCARHQQALRRGECDTYVLQVRKHCDGRMLVSGILDASNDDDDCRGGELLDASADVSASIRRVGKFCNLPDRIIRRCIADLPPEDLDAGGEMAGALPERHDCSDHAAKVTSCLVETNELPVEARGELSQMELSILHSLRHMLPAAARSYEQAVVSIGLGSCISWRGTAAELREVLREVIDHLAPDHRVISSRGFKLEEEQERPTQRQKVRFILNTRRSSSAAVAVAEGSLNVVDEAVASMARLTYTRGAASTHGSTYSNEIRNLKRYLDALLAELLRVS